jgi:ribulose-phosphate 3-epimerase
MALAKSAASVDFCEEALVAAPTLPFVSISQDSLGWFGRARSAVRDAWAGVRRREIAYYIFRYRYLAFFTLIGLFSLLAELAVLSRLPGDWPRGVRVGTAFVASLALSLTLNLTLNFHVPRRYLARTTAWYVLISVGSFALNFATIGLLEAATDAAYGELRLTSAGALFMLAYTLHRRFTFSDSRNFGIAVYATEAEDVGRIFDRVGHFCDHIHVDLVDRTVNAAAAPPQLDRVDEARRYWKGYPVCLHVMSRRPRQWVEQVWDRVDWLLLPCESEDDLAELIFDCRLRGKKVGVVWRQGIPLSALLGYLPHVDFVMVLGIAEPGRSGQQISPQGLAVAQTLEAMRSRYDYELMFDGGVKTSNISAIPGRYVVSASAVLNAEEPTEAAHVLRLSPYRQRSRRAA